jgi:hypothetical protein
MQVHNTSTSASQKKQRHYQVINPDKIILSEQQFHTQARTSISKRVAAERRFEKARDAFNRAISDADRAYENKASKSCALLNELVAYDTIVNEAGKLNCNYYYNNNDWLAEKQKIRILARAINQVKRELGKLHYWDSELGKVEHGKLFSIIKSDTAAQHFREFMKKNLPQQNQNATLSNASPHDIALAYMNARKQMTDQSSQ